MTRTLEHLNPADLVLTTNIRAAATLDPDFIASIRERGILEPVLAHRNSVGVVVDQGARRTLAAMQLGLSTIPVVVAADTPLDGDRIADQLIENEHRAPLTNSERAAAAQQLALLGWTPAQIAKRTATPKPSVAAALAVAASPTAAAHADTLTLEDAATLAEFDGDTDATERLLRQAHSGRGLEHTAQRIRDERAVQAAIAERAAGLAAEGLTVIDAPSWSDTKTLRLTKLRDGRRRIDAKKHADSCAGHVSWVEHERSYDATSPLATVHGCRGWAKHGHTSADGSGGKLAAADMNDEQREQARRERRHVIESNKAWKAATTVRRRWLAEFARRKTAPTGAEQYIAAAVLSGGLEHAGISSYIVDDNTGLFRAIGCGSETVRGELATASPKRLLQILLAVTLGAWEASTTDDTWRSTHQAGHAAAALKAISQWGYELSDIEQAIVDGTASQPE